MTLFEKSSIVLTPTAYSDGSLNTVIPPYQVLPQELVTNGDFSDGTTNWTPNTNATLSIDNGRLKVAISGGSGYPSQNITTVVGKKYKITADAFIGTATKVSLYSAAFGFNDLTADGSYNLTFTATSTSTQVRLYVYGDGTYGFWDNVSVKEIQEADFDFSRGSSATRVNEKGLIEDVQILSGNLVQNGDFEQIGSEEVTNGDFATDSDWVKDTGWTIDNGKASQDGTGTGNDGDIIQVSILDTSKIYKIVLDVVDYTQGTLYIDTSNIDLNVNGIGTYTLYFTPSSPNLFIRTRFSGFIGSIDNVSVKEVGQNWGFGSAWGIENGKALYDGSSNGSLIQQYNILTSGKKYKASFNVLDNSGRFRISVDGGASTYQTYTTGNGYYTFEFTSTSTNFRIGGSMADSAGTFSIDNISLIEITDDTDIPRIDYTSGQGALLLEPQRTNSVTYSEELTTNWTRTSISTPTDANIDAPDGASTVKRLQTNNADGSIAFTYNTGFNQTSGTTYTVSVYAKSNTNENQIFGLFGNGSGASNGHSGNLTATNDWQRFTYTFTANNTSTIGICKGDDRLAFDILFWGFQIEAGSYATSYIPTEGATVTRSADVANNSGNADLINSTEGVLYAEISALADDLTRRIITITDGTLNNIVKLEYKNISNQIEAVLYNGNTECLILHTLLDETEFNKIAFKYKQDDFSLFVNGIEVGADTSGVVFPQNTLNNLSFYQGNSNNLYGNVKSVAVFKEALTDAELESLTSWISFVEMATDLEYTLE